MSASGEWRSTDDPASAEAVLPAPHANEREFRERLQRALSEQYELRELIGRDGGRQGVATRLVKVEAGAYLERKT